MSAVEGHHQRGALDDLMADGMLLQNIGAVPGEDDVIFIVKQACRQPVSITAIASKKNVRIFQMKGPQLVGEIASLIAFGIADAKGSYQTGRGILDFADRSLHPLQDGFCLQKEYSSGRGKRYRAAGTVEQLDVHRFLQSANLLGDGGLGYVILVCGLGKTPVLCDCHKVF